MTYFQYSSYVQLAEVIHVVTYHSLDWFEGKFTGTRFCFHGENHGFRSKFSQQNQLSRTRSLCRGAPSSADGTSSCRVGRMEISLGEKHDQKSMSMGIWENHPRIMGFIVGVSENGGLTSIS